jgi:hypothetical protein
MPKSKEAKLAEETRKAGFNKSKVSTNENGDKSVSVICDQCCAMVVNNVPVHEHGCPNTKRRL